MWKKEILDTLKQTGLVLSFLLLIPIIFGINQVRLSENMPFLYYAVWVITVLIPLLVFSLAYKMFAAEDTDNASEFLKSLPISVWKLLALKIVPRLAIVWLFVIVFNELISATWWSHGIRSSWVNTNLEGRITNILFPLIALLSGFILGLTDRKNPILIIALLLPAFFLLTMVEGSSINVKLLQGYWIYFMKPSGITPVWVWQIGRVLAFSVSAIIPATLPILVLVPVIKSWDSSSEKVRSQGILKRMSVPLVLIICLYTVEQFHLF